MSRMIFLLALGCSGAFGQSKLAVMPFENKGNGPEWMQYGIPHTLIEAFRATAKVDPISLDEVNRAATDIDIRPRSLFEGIVTPGFLRYAADWGTDYIIVGQYGALDDSLWISFRIAILSKKAFTPIASAGGRFGKFTEFFVTALRLEEKVFSEFILQTDKPLERGDLTKMNDRTRALVADYEGLQAYLQSWMALQSYEKGLRDAEKSKWDDAIEAFQRTVRLDAAGTLNARVNLSKSYVMRANVRATEKPDEALADLQEAIRLDSTNAEACYNAGNLYKQQSKWDEALEQYARALARKSDYFEAHVNTGFVLLQQGRASESVAAYEAAVKIRDDDASVHFFLGGAHDLAGNIPAAKTSYQRALALDSSLGDAHLNIGILYSMEKNAALAKSHYTKALTYSPNSALAHRNLGILLMNDKKEAKQAIYHLEKTLEIDLHQDDADVIRKNIAILKKRVKKK